MSKVEEPSKFAIHEAARDGRTSVVESLLAANPKLATLQDDDERYPIHWAVSYNHYDTVLLLSNTKNFDPDVQDGSGWTPLMIAASLPEPDALVKLLLDKGCDLNATNHQGQNVLHFVASKKNIDLARLLLTYAPPASPRCKDRRGQYAIHRAAAIGSVPMIELLLKHRSPLNPTDVAGQTPLHHAIAEGHGDTAVALLKAGAETDKKDVEGWTAIDLAPDASVRKYIARYAEEEGINLYSDRE